MIGVRRPARSRGVVARLLTVAALGTAGLALAVPGAQAKTGWKVNATVKNTIASSALTCGNTGLLGCVSPFYWTSVGDVDDVNVPVEVAAGATGSFSFTSPSLVEGGDMYVDYTMPTGSKYEVLVEDDDHVSGYTGAGNYVGCTQSTPQGDAAAVCSAQWGGTYEAMTPTITFGPSAQAPVLSVGQRCSGTLGWETILLDCMDTKQWSPVDPNLPMWVSFRAVTPEAVYVQQQTGGPNCRMGQGYASSCSLVIQPGQPLQIGSLNNTGAATYTVEVMATAIGHSLPVGGALPPDPNPSSSSVAAVRQLRVNPGAVRPATSGAPVVTKQPAKNRGAKIRYRASQRGTTVFSIARKTARGWRTLPGRTANADLIGSGVKRGGRCVRATAASKGTPCRFRSRLRGHFAHHGTKGANVVEFTGRLAGKRLPAGSYRLTARTRPHRSDRVSAPVVTRFTVAG